MIRRIQFWVVAACLGIFLLDISVAQKRSTDGAALAGLLPVESFEGDTFPPAGWKKITEFDGLGWRRAQVGSVVPGFEDDITVDSPPGGGDFVALASWATGDADSNFTTDQQTDQWLITPQIASVEVGDSLKFQLRYVFAFVENFEILVSRTDADSIASFDTTLFAVVFDSASSNEWRKYSLSLEEFAGQDIFVAFRERVNTTFNQGDGLLLDLAEVSSLVTSVATRPTLPEQPLLYQNYPNPFNPTTRIRFSLASQAEVSMSVFNLRGQQVALLLDSETRPAGDHVVDFDASRLPNGIYYYRISTHDFTNVKEMTLLR